MGKQLINLIPLIIVIVAFFIGIVIDKIIRVKLTKIAEQTKWRGVEIILKALHQMPVLCLLLIGIDIAIGYGKEHPYIKKLLNSPYAHNALVVAIILLVTIFCSRVAVGFVKFYAEKVTNIFPSISIAVIAIRIGFFSISALIILQTLGISIAPILTALGIGGVPIALALKDTLSNLFSGLQLILARQIKQGDYIKLDSGEEGYITDITWKNTTIRQLSDNMIVIPNSKLSSVNVINYYLPQKELAVSIQVGVSYDSDLDKVERVTIEVAREVMKELPCGVPEFEPSIRYHTFADSSINFTVNLRAKEFSDQALIKHEFVKRLHKRYAEEGIVIPFPIQTVYMEENRENAEDILHRDRS